MPRQSRKDAAKNPRPAGQEETRIEPAVSYRLHKELCITCPMCGLMAATNIKLEDKTEIPRFTGKPFDIQLFLHQYGGRRTAPRGTPKGKRQKKAKGVHEYTNITESHATELQKLQRQMLESAAAISKILEPFFIQGVGEVKVPIKRARRKI